MRNSPPQFCDWEFLVHALEYRQELVDILVGVPMHRDRHFAFGSPANDLVILFEIRFRSLAVNSVHRPRNAFTNAVEVEHIVSEIHRHHCKIAFVFVELGSRCHTAQAIRHPNREFPTSPNLKKSLIAFGRGVIASGIDNARQTETIEFEEELLRTFDLLFERRLWKAIEELHHTSRNDSGGITAGILFHL